MNKLGEQPSIFWWLQKSRGAAVRCSYSEITVSTVLLFEVEVLRNETCEATVS